MKNIEQFLEHKAYQLRVSSIRMTTQAGSGHVTTALSCADIISVLFFYAMRFDPKNPNMPGNDHFILSKGHGVPVLYAVWKELGVLTEQDLMTYRKLNAVLEGHPTPRFSRTEAATGSLGQGLSIGLGMSLQARQDNLDNRVWVLCGDAEMAEGSIWEAVQIAAHYKMNNLTAIIDVNRLGQTGQTMQGHEVQRFARMFEACGWRTLIIDGHKISDIMKACDVVKTGVDRRTDSKKSKYQEAESPKTEGPMVIIAKTLKGCGVSLAEDKLGFHGKPFSTQEMTTALEQLAARYPQAAAFKEEEPWQPQLLLQKSETVKRTETMPLPTYAKGKEIATRYAYGQAITALGSVKDDVMVLDAEVKNSTFAELFEAAYPERFIQCFVAEQNMIGMAVGLAARGKRVFASTFACFFSRAFDQIRMAAIGRSTIKLVGSHVGVSIGQDGPSQMGLEDIAMMRAVPNSVVLQPCDAVSTWKLVNHMANYQDGISYMRTLRSATPVIYDNNEEFPLGGCKVLRQSNNDQACIVATGITVFEALKAYDLLQKESIPVAVVDLYCIKPLPGDLLRDLVQRSGKCVITVEDHYLDGGMGQAVAYELRNNQVKVACCAVTKLPTSGAPAELLAQHEIDAAALVARVKSLLSKPADAKPAETKNV